MKSRKEALKSLLDDVTAGRSLNQAKARMTLLRVQQMKIWCVLPFLLPDELILANNREEAINKELMELKAANERRT